jgi:hypothetical protein
MDTALFLLKQLHQISNGNVDHEVNFNVMAADLDLGRMERDNAFRFLLNKKYILNSGMGYGCSITPEGIAAIVNVKEKRSGIMPSINTRLGDYFKTAILTKLLDYKVEY